VGIAGPESTAKLVGRVLRPWLELGDTASRRGPRQRRLPCPSNYARGCAAVSILAGGLVALGSRRGAHGLASLLPADIDALESPTITAALGVQLLLFGGFRQSSQGWLRAASPPTSLQERVDLVAPTWKAGGRLDYSWPSSGSDPPVASAMDANDAPLSLFAAGAALADLGAGTTVQSLTRTLEGIGLRANDFDGAAREALVEMLTWRLPAASERLVLHDSADLALLALSFDATPDCRSLVDCSRPGPSNELLAATAREFVERRLSEHGQRVNVIAQWEVAAALRSLGGLPGGTRVIPIGTPGIFQNTAQIFEQMRQALQELDPAAACGHGPVGAGTISSRLLLLTHPDHLRRSLRIGETALAAGATAPCDGLKLGPPKLVPGLQPYRLDWSGHPRKGGGARRVAVQLGPPAGSTLDIYTGVSGRVHTSGHLREASWYSDPHGFFPDGSPQRWTHRREIWVAYEFWARAKGVATGVIAPPPA